jgi:hypothetical protein
MKNTSTLVILLGLFLLASAAMAVTPQQNQSLPKEKASASDYSIGSNSLHGEVLEMRGKQFSMRDSANGKTVEVEVADEVMLSDIKPGDHVRVGFSTDPNVAAEVNKEPDKK